jgi:hypothetical protein
MIMWSWGLENHLASPVIKIAEIASLKITIKGTS